MTENVWFRDCQAWRLILLGYVPWMAGLNLAWEAAHVRLYTLWHEAEPAYVWFSVLHCTLGDVLIGASVLFLVLIAGRGGPAARWRWLPLAVATALIGAGYTVFSEWMNITLFRSWIYAPSMPTLDLGSFELGVTPLVQWLVVPPMSLYLAKRSLLLRFARTVARWE